ncbi:MAG: amino acid ABC transporter permease [Halodesulfurarchaeum sp.]
MTDWEFIWSQRWYLLGGLWITIKLTVASILLGFLAGFPGGALEVYGGKFSRGIVSVVGVILRGTPILVIFIFTYFVFPIGSAYMAAVVGLGLRSAAYQTQIFRGALQSVGAGQMEAARAMGLTKLKAILYVIVPQALRRSIPGFQNEFTIVLKDTSIAFAIGLSELIARSYDIFTTPGHTTAVTEIILLAAGIYFVLTFTTNRSLDYLNDMYAIPSGEE